MFVWGVSRLFRGGRKGWGTFAIISILGWGIFIAIWGFFFTPKPGSSLYLSFDKGDPSRSRADRLWGPANRGRVANGVAARGATSLVALDPPSIWESHPDFPAQSSSPVD